MSNSKRKFADVTAASDQKWLLKVPKDVAAAIKDAPPGTDLGSLVFSRTSKSKKFEVSISSLNLPNDSTTEYSIESLAKTTAGTIYPFDDEGERGVSVKGVVVRSGALRPVHNETYAKKIKNRSIETSVRDRIVRSIETTDLSTRSTVTVDGEGGFGQHIASHNNRVKKTSSSMEGDIRDVMFSLFAESKRWSVKDIVRKSNRNEKEIREVLESIAKYARAGEHRGTWGLLDEYK